MLPWWLRKTLRSGWKKLKSMKWLAMCKERIADQCLAYLEADPPILPLPTILDQLLKQRFLSLGGNTR